MKDKPLVAVPARSRDSKVTKRSVLPSSRRDSRQSSISSAAQEQLEHLAKEASSTVLKQEAARLGAPILEPRGQGDEGGNGLGLVISNGIGVGMGNISESITAAGGIHIHPGDSPIQTLSSSATEDFHLDHQMRDHSSSSMSSDSHPRTAADIAHEAYGDALKIDNAVCKKLATVAARRVATQRRTDQKLNMERRSNVEALLAQITGGLPPKPCKNCFKGHGPWTQCVVFSGQMCGSCANCWFNASGSRCTFHENNHPNLSRRYIPSEITAPSPPPSKSNAMHKPSSSQLTSIASFQAANVDRWNVSEGTKRLIQQTMGDVATYSRRDRYLARIEAAAEELGMRIAEYEDYLATPEGIADQRAALEREQAAEGSQRSLVMDGEHRLDASMRDASQETVRS